MADKSKTMLFVAGGIGLALMLSMASPVQAASVRIPRGRLRYPKESSNPEDETALARVIASEASNEPRIVQVAVAWATINAARKVGTSITGLVKTPGNTYGPQSRGSYASTKLAPKARHRQLARSILAGKIGDPTQGATQYDSPRAQRILLKRGAKGYRKTPEQVAATRRAAGKRLVLLPGIPEERFRMWA